MFLSGPETPGLPKAEVGVGKIWKHALSYMAFHRY